MKFIYKQEIIDFDFYKTKSDKTILFLHGFGGDKNSFVEAKNILTSKFNILTLTMPTLKTSKEVWDIYDYANLVSCLLNTLNLNNIFILCHSFGFRVATILKNKVNIEKIFVTGGACIKKNDLFYSINLNNKIINKKYTNLDYYKMDKNSRETFKNIVNFNYLPFLKFNCPMYLFWGKRDNETKLFIAKKLKKINKCDLLIVNGGHFAYLEQNQQFLHKLKEFLC